MIQKSTFTDIPHSTGCISIQLIFESGHLSYQSPYVGWRDHAINGWVGVAFDNRPGSPPRGSAAALQTAGSISNSGDGAPPADKRFLEPTRHAPYRDTAPPALPARLSRYRLSDAPSPPTATLPLRRSQPAYRDTGPPALPARLSRYRLSGAPSPPIVAAARRSSYRERAGPPPGKVGVDERRLRASIVDGGRADEETTPGRTETGSDRSAPPAAPGEGEGAGQEPKGN